MERLELEFECPMCGVQPHEMCQSIYNRKPCRVHGARLALPCQETFIGYYNTLNGQDMRCARKKGHKSRHRTLDGRLEWSLDHNPGTFLHELLEAVME